MYIRPVPKNMEQDIRHALDENEVQYDVVLVKDDKTSVAFRMHDGDYLKWKHLINHFTGEVSVAHRVWHV